MTSEADLQLEEAIDRWFAIMHPGVIRTGYVLQLSGVSPLDDSDSTRMTFSVPDEQPLFVSLGLIEYARLEAAQWHGGQERLE